jgi:hypothetical protein
VVAIQDHCDVRRDDDDLRVDGVSRLVRELPGSAARTASSSLCSPIQRLSAGGLKARDIGMVTKSATAACGKDGPGTEAVPAKPGDKADTVKAPDGNGAAPGT